MSNSDLDSFSLEDFENDSLFFSFIERDEEALVQRFFSFIERDEEAIVQRRQKRSRKNYRKPPFRVSFIPSLRILKRDIRRKYLDMFNNVINSHNMQLFSSFIDDFYCSDAVMINNFCDNHPPCFKAVEIQGRDLLKRMQAMNQLILPDSVMRMSNAQICKRLHEDGSRIVGNFDVRATAIYLPKLYKGEEVDSNSVIVDYDMDPKEFSHFERPEDLMNHIQLAKTPIELHFIGTYEMVLDESHRIMRFSVLYQTVKVSDISLLNTAM